MVLTVLQRLLLTPTVWALLLQEQELKAAADGVLSEVRKKQADTKRMVDILRALEKLRKLRKEAAARKGN